MTAFRTGVKFGAGLIGGYAAVCLGLAALLDLIDALERALKGSR